ncbi:winged helix-turn-helix transcriptional regulator [Dactylosporangium sp. CA-152071]|uniref:winged helix-turn-helix transcriptional regulator n=1 Tax=Dactylosporangium sp. CA-152071 TaxID=3239933 RepID=UPI003D93775A
MSVADIAVGPQTGTDVPAEPRAAEDSGIRDLLARLGDRWTVLVLVELSHGVRRFRELERAVPGISQRMLTVTTKRLCRDGLVERTAYATIPTQVDYRLTPMGRSMAGVIDALAEWSREHMDEIGAARARWDATASPI